MPRVRRGTRTTVLAAALALVTTGAIGVAQSAQAGVTSLEAAPSAADLYVDPTTQAYGAWEAASGTDKDLLAKIALTPQAYWVGDWTGADQTRQQVADYTSRAAAAGQTGILTVYAIPGRDCGNHSGGGVPESEYARWVDTVASGI